MDVHYFPRAPELVLDCCPTPDKDTPPPANQDCTTANLSRTGHWQLREGSSASNPQTCCVSAGGLLTPCVHHEHPPASPPAEPGSVLMVLEKTTEKLREKGGRRDALPPSLQPSPAPMAKPWQGAGRVGGLHGEPPTQGTCVGPGYGVTASARLQEKNKD